MRLPHVSGLKRVSGIATSVGSCAQDTPLSQAISHFVDTDVLVYMVMARPRLSDRRWSIWRGAQDRPR